MANAAPPPAQPQAWYETKEGALEKLGLALLALARLIATLGQRALAAAGKESAAGKDGAAGVDDWPRVAADEAPTLVMRSPQGFVFSSGPHATGEPRPRAEHPSLADGWPAPRD